MTCLCIIVQNCIICCWRIMNEKPALEKSGSRQGFLLEIRPLWIKVSLKEEPEEQRCGFCRGTQTWMRTLLNAGDSADVYNDRHGKRAVSGERKSSSCRSKPRQCLLFTTECKKRYSDECSSCSFLCNCSEC